MIHKIFLTKDAEADLVDIYQYIASEDGTNRADNVLDKIEAVINKLEKFPERGSIPKELLDLGIREYRQVFFKPYRMIYRVMGKRVYVFLITDGRKDMQALLARRLFTSEP